MTLNGKSTTQNPKKVFITGIAGFIGFHLALYLHDRGDFVCGCDNFNEYYDPDLKKKRARILKDTGIQVIESEIHNSPLLEKAISEHEITHFVHLAAQAGVRHSIQYPEQYVHANLDGFVQVLEVCKRHPVMKFIYASSSSVYGLNQKVPFSEHDATDKPASFYGATKKSNELIAAAYHNIHGMDVTGLRFFTVYGPWGRPDMAYFSFTQRIMQGLPIQLFNQGQMKRDFTYIDDIVRGTASAIDLGAKCEIFNLGNNRTEDLSELISIIEKLTGKKALKQLLPMQTGDVTITYADISKSQDQLGYKPLVSLQEGMEHFMNWYRQYYR
ncbi:MAG TPA: NAD-dependent epimerase/dehydratase family protein [Rhabdochlamydiaceae bacterium]|nr:NAD-dependent epimerase/dehydratase family protein [Rhabdochlamydiaceae bacterium]